MKGPEYDRSHHLLGINLTLASVFFFVAMNLLTKYMSVCSENIKSNEKALLRMFVGAAVMFALAGLGVFRLRIGNLRLLALRGALGGIVALLYFYAIDATSAARATFFFYTYMAWGAVFSHFFLGEPLGRRRLPGLVVLYAGAVMMLMDSGGAGVSLRGDAVGLLSGFLAGAAATTMRALHRSDTSWMIFLSMCVFGTVAGSAAVLTTGSFVMPNMFEWGLLIAIGLAGTAAHLLLTSGFKYLDVPTVGALEMSAAPATAVAAYFLLNEKGASWLSFAGGALLLAGGVFLAATTRARTVERTV